LSNFSALDFKANANIPLSDALFAKVAIYSHERDGYIPNVYGPSMVPTNIHVVIRGAAACQGYRLYRP